jgi:hypothetical protein
MNERIDKLFGKALDAAVPETWTVLNPEQLSRLKTKFAELIVRECMNVLDPGEHQLIARFQARKWLAEHFGVEEPKGWICPKCNADRTKIACPLGFGATVDGRCPMTVEAQ